VIRVIIADSSELSLIGLRAVFNEVPDINVVGIARTLEELEDTVRSAVVDVVLVDHSAEGFGEEALQLIPRCSSRVKVVCISHDPASMTVRNAIRLGVRSYVKKDCDIQEIIDSVVRSARGEHFFCGKILEKLEVEELNLEEMVGEPLSCDPITLSKRETEIVCMIVEGHSYTQIADRLNISSHTVTTHRKNIMGKLGVNNTAALVMYAVKVGLVSPNRFLFSA
jgi:DNA-binding NarL/FixJ family response regulator